MATPKTYTIRQTYWDSLGAADFRLLHADNTVTIEDPLFKKSVVNYAQAAGTLCSAVGQAIWDGSNGSNWKRGARTVQGKKVRIYVKTGIALDPNDPEGGGNPEEHVLVMLAIGDNLFGTLTHFDDAGHTGQWR